ncbi:MAG TPA: tetratricopeptide repeat protein [Anaeromyxobacter sp.]
MSPPRDAGAATARSHAGVPGSPLVHAAAIALAGLLAYSNAFRVPFQLDDGKNIVENPAVKDVAAFFARPGIPTRAVGFFTFALDGSLHGESVGGYHATNLAIHLAAAICVYLLTVLACRAAARGVDGPDPALAAGASVAGLAAGLLFVAHPLQTQAVTYVVQRLASLATLLYVGTVLAYGHAALADRPSRRAAPYAVALALAGLALFTKENAITLPLALLAFDLAFLPGAARARLVRLAPFAALAALVVAAFLAPGRSIATAASEYREAGAVAGLPPWAAYLLTQPRVVLAYLRLLVLPVGQNVDPDPPLAASPLEAGVLLPAAALALLLGIPALLAWRARRRSALARVVLFALAWLVAGLAVESSVVPLADPMAEHRMYLPSAGIFLASGAALAWGLERLSPERRRWAVAAAAACLVALGAATFARNSVWRDRLSLWSDALAKSPGKSRPYVYVAQDMLDRGDAQGAIALLRRAAALSSPAPHVFLTLGVAYEKLGRPADAERAYRDGIARGGGALRGAHRAIAMLLLESGRVAEACEHLAAELRVDAANRAVRDNAASCRYARGDLAGAAADWARLAAEDPRDAPVLYNLALSYAALGDVPRARETFTRFLAAAGPPLAPQATEARRWIAEHAAVGAGSPAPR